MKFPTGKNDINYMAVELRKIDITPPPRQIGLRHLDNKELMNLHRAGKLSQVVNYHGPLDPQSYVEVDCSIRSSLETETLASILGERCKLGKHRFLQVPPHLEILRDRLFYLLLEEVDWQASVGDISEQDYRVDRGKTTLCFFDEQRRLVALMPGGEINEVMMPDFIPPDLMRPQIEVVSLIRGREVTVLDAGIGRSTTIYAVMRHLRELGKQVTGYGINLTAELSPPNSAVPIFTGMFEDQAFSVQFDLVYSQVGSSFYAPNIKKYVRKLLSVLKPGGAALLNIANFHLWERELRIAGAVYTPLYNIIGTFWIDKALQNPDANQTPAALLEKFKQPSGLLIQLP
ncbi:MAG: class I SAM-dependent methyltransferase [Candidatus Margulisiibacteriota bacterium]